MTFHKPCQIPIDQIKGRIAATCRRTGTPFAFGPSVADVTQQCQEKGISDKDYAFHVFSSRQMRLMREFKVPSTDDRGTNK